VLPVDAGRYSGLQAVKGKLAWLDADDAPDESGQVSASLHVYDLAKRVDKTVLSGIDPSFPLSRAGAKVMYHKDAVFGIVDLAEGKKPGDGKIDTRSLMAWVDPRLEAKQMFEEAWRLERDFYCDPGRAAWTGTRSGPLPAAAAVRRTPRRPQLPDRRAGHFAHLSLRR
jgi:tricorn protease